MLEFVKVRAFLFLSHNLFSFSPFPKAALFGKSFIPEMNPEPCKKTIFTLRVLNAVRDHRVGEFGFYLSSCDLFLQALSFLIGAMATRDQKPILLRAILGVRNTDVMRDEMCNKHFTHLV